MDTIALIVGYTVMVVLGLGVCIGLTCTSVEHYAKRLGTTVEIAQWIAQRKNAQKRGENDGL